MAINSSIEWTESTWNPVTGCTKISDGCKHCYAERMAKRLKAMRQPNYKNGFNVTLHPQSIELPLSWKSPQSIFVNSMSDLFHKDIPIDFIKEVFLVMNNAHWHKFQILTKRAERLLEFNNILNWTSNIWMGVSVENDECTYRIDLLRKSQAKVKFISFEPLLGPISNCNYQEISWVIVGGESGPGARPVQEKWVVEIRDNCVKNNVPFFFKQWGGVNKKKAGRMLEGRTWDSMPVLKFA